ncbi:hypothetical protein EIN_058830 [Entamoeba invadens IP1]|uniref:Uncharacterized protein n=1 Tax=Entamoeba invadens TaxID=33085 RepID=S0B3K9_ENTIV|nr:hypothetical protein EIN_058830 [Entamoeba invadens IP1]ELP93428.1 hypothetical protein EIN_058830 [Entamoeba invadens IP1]BAN41146.1 hypothetical protein, conserved [Entamoeba invadens]|eukprot:XP_004260199.1 hypothetical protein EIN_058830 [Entamoeba invadens IP1]
MSSSFFAGHNKIIGMVHVHALPGTPSYQPTARRIRGIIDKAVEEASLYKQCGLDTIIIENMHDVPYLNATAGPEITSAMSIVGYEIKRQMSNLRVGVQILAAANKQAIASAFCSGCDFIRAEGFVFGHVADEGYIDSNAGEILRYRKMIGADDVLVFTDIKKKHSAHAITADVSLTDTAKTAQYFLSDGLIVTGTSTGVKTDPQEVRDVKKAVTIPVLVGSGVTPENINEYQLSADGIIVGSYFKVDGFWKNELSKDRILKLLSAVNDSQ